MTIDDALTVARALKSTQAAGGGTARLYDKAGKTCLVVSWAPVDALACIILPRSHPDGGNSVLTVPAVNL